MDKLRRERESRGWSYKDAAKLVGISKPFYWQLENEKRNFTYELAIRVALVFQTTSDELLYQDVMKRLKREHRL